MGKNWFFHNLWWLLSIIIFLSPFIIKTFLKKREFTNQELINIAATLGVLGTFIGIFISLWNFDVTNIESSIPQILEGLKTAFATSISGMLIGLIIKFRKNELYKKINKIEPEMERIDNVLELLKDINFNSYEFLKTIIEKLNNIEQSIINEEDNSILSHILNFKNELIEKQNELINEFKEFSKNVSESSTKAFIDALTEVIKDFNSKINEQFGENFKQLNLSVQNMIEWQEKYKDHMKHFEEKNQQILVIMIETQKIIENVVEKSNSFSQIAEKLHLTIESIKQNNYELSDRIKSFSEISKKASEALPTVVNNVNELTGKFSKVVTESIQKSHESYTVLKNNVTTQIENIDNNHKKFNQILESMIKDTNEKISIQFLEFDKNLANELNKCIGSLGSSLASLSNKFVSDYLPLTEKLKEVVELSKNIK